MTPVKRLQDRPPTVSRTTELELAITRGQGRVIEALASGSFEPGEYAFAWDAESLGPGVYFLRLTAGDLVQKHKLLDQF